MGLFSMQKEPIFLKESSNAEKQLAQLKALEPLLNAEGQKRIKKDIKLLEYGIAGEKNIVFELQNSHMFMAVLQDIYLEYEGLSAQIDFLVFTKKICFVIECKNLYGNIEIKKSGDFVRKLQYGRKKVEEGFYSPITQNNRHLNLMKQIKVGNTSNGIAKFVMDKNFESFYKTIVVLANHKTILNMRNAPLDVKEKVIRADHLIRYIKNRYKESKEIAYSESAAMQWAQSYLALHQEIRKDYTKNYQQYVVELDKPKQGQTFSKVAPSVSIVTPKKKVEATIHQNIVNDQPASQSVKEDSDLYQALKDYRLLTSRAEDVKAYYVYTNKQMTEIVLKLPRTKEELIAIKGFGPKKVEKYGEDILRIIHNHL